MKTVALTLQRYLALRLNLVIYLAGFLIPLIFTHPQVVTGTIVNALIFTVADRLSKKALWPILILPSLGAVSRGLLFGPQTFFLIYFLPFIWLGNYVQVTVFGLTKGQSYGLRIGGAAVAKYIVLVGIANIYFRLNIVPQLFVMSMGAIQLITACLGGLVAKCLKSIA
ncbi:MAG: hypothetical protein NTZ93_02190 [Candidatus Beckwithbacteria bacterium]|nr:hypothetical protein [Candidatus Beckwithbacteria bacterium]